MKKDIKEEDISADDLTSWTKDIHQHSNHLVQASRESPSSLNISGIKMEENVSVKEEEVDGDTCKNTIVLAPLHDIPNNDEKSVKEETEDVDTARYPAVESLDVRGIDFLKTDLAEIL